MRYAVLFLFVTCLFVLSSPNQGDSHVSAASYLAPISDSLIDSVIAKDDGIKDGDEFVCIDGKCMPRSAFRLAASGNSSGCSTSASQQSSSCFSSSNRAAFPMARAFGTGLYRITHPRTWFPRARQRASGCGG